MTLNYYMLFILMSLVAGTLVAVLLCRSAGVGRRTLFYTTFLSLFTTSIMAFWSVIIFSGGKLYGFSGLGGMAGLIIGLTISFYIFREHTVEIFASWIVSAPLMYAVSKMGCFTSGCCGGSLFGFPIQPVEAVLFLLIFVISLILFFIASNRMISVYTAMILSFIVRFSVEFGRYDHVSGSLSLNQILVLTAGVAAVLVFLFRTRLPLPHDNDWGIEK